jgi:hypothetical protein
MKFSWIYFFASVSLLYSFYFCSISVNSSPFLDINTILNFNLKWQKILKWRFFFINSLHLQMSKNCNEDVRFDIGQVGNSTKKKIGILNNQ